MAETPVTETDAERAAMLAINERQRSFYEKEAPGEGSSVATGVWWRLRGSMGRVRRSAGIMDLVHQRHIEWLGDLQGKRVLDLGCYAGNKISLQLAEQSDYYLGVDLSETGLAKLRAKLDAKGLTHAETKALDFLDENFPYEPFDLIYATSVLHHFRHFETVLQLLHARLKPGGSVISFDPLQTSLLNRTARAIYRPFQSDADWEFPFTRETFRHVDKYFEIEAVQGIMGRSKWAIPLAYLPGAGPLAERLGKRWHQRDVREAQQPGPALWACMQVALHLRRRDDAPNPLLPAQPSSTP